MRNALLAVLILFSFVSPARAQFCPGGTGYVFSDVQASDPFCGYITWIAQNEISLGCQVIDSSTRLYCPNDTVSRSQMSAFVTRMAANSVFAQGGNAFGAIAALGTLDAFPVEIYAGGWRVMRFEPSSSDSPNLIAGYRGNTAAVQSVGTTIAGGGSGEDDCLDPVTGAEGAICANRTAKIYSTVGGGAGNAALTSLATVAGGQSNVAGPDPSYEFGGYGATIGGGLQNIARGLYSTIAGGIKNRTIGAFETAMQAVGGGQDNVAQGAFGTIPGGWANTAGGDFSFAAGRRAKAMAAGCFTWGDGTDADVTCATDNAFVVRSTGGFVIGTNAAMTTGCSIAPGGGAWDCTSSRDAKTEFDSVDGAEMLRKVAALPISTWQYKQDSRGARHIGPVAEDFREAFGVGDSDRSIGVLDASGVALAAIQGLNAKLEAKVAEQSREIDAQREEIAELKRAVRALMERSRDR